MSDEQDDKERGEWLHSLSHIHEGEHAELEFARTWADSVEVDYDEGPCAIGFTKNGATYWYLIDDVGWDVDDPRSEMLAAALAERDDLRAHLTTALRERDEARRECERLRALLTEACDKWAGYIEHRRSVLQHIEATCEDDADLAEAERGLQVLEHDVRDNLRIRANAWRPSPATDKEEP